MANLDGILRSAARTLGMPEVPAARPNRRIPARPLDYTAAAGTIAVTALICLALRDRLTTIDVVMLFLLAVVIVASRHARGPAVLATVLSIACFDFLFVPPYYTFAVHDTAYVLTFAMMFVVALVMSGLTARIREHAAVATARERRMAALYGMNRDLAGAATPEAIATIVATHVGRAAGGEAEVVLDADASEVEVWDGQGIVLTLQSPLKRFGLVAVRGPGIAHPMPEDEHYVLELLANQAGLALERLALAERNEQSRVEIEAERLRTALLSSLSHDLRTPLGTIEGAGTALVEDAETLSADSRRDLAETIVEEVRRMARLVSNLLDMMRLETGTLAVHRSWQPLEESLGVALIRLDERLKGHAVEINLPADLPLVCVDDVLLEQVFLNLLDNAAKYTPPTTPLSVTAWLENFNVVVEVADRGPGIPVGEETAVFRKFHRAPMGEGSTMPAGSGLGLTICEGIIKAHGGRIWVEHRAGGGAGVPVHAAARCGAAASAGGRRAVERNGALTMATANPVVLIIEDDPQMRRMLQTALRSHDYHVVEAGTAREGLAQAAGRNPDIILLDLGLPDGDGLDVARTLRKSTRMPIIVLSARGQERDKIAALDLGADDYLTKPFGINELLARIRVALRHATAPLDATTEPVFEAGDLRVDLALRRSLPRWRGSAPHAHGVQAARRC